MVDIAFQKNSEARQLLNPDLLRTCKEYRQLFNISMINLSCSSLVVKNQYSRLLFLIPFIFLLLGCSTRYIVTSDKYAQYEGEVNQHTRLIRADARRIFRILTHEDKFKAVCPKGTIVTYESPLPYQVGTYVDTRIDYIYKLRWRSQVVEVIPDKKIRQQFLDGFFAGGTEIWELEPENGFAKITHTIIFQPQGFLKKLAWSLKVRGKHDKMTEVFLDNLKRDAETE